MRDRRVQYHLSHLPRQHILTLASVSVRPTVKDQPSELPFPSPGYLPNLGIQLGSPALHADSLLSKPLGNPLIHSRAIISTTWSFRNSMTCQTPTHNKKMSQRVQLGRNEDILPRNDMS